jgi:hypothetical protein
MPRRDRGTKGRVVPSTLNRDCPDAMRRSDLREAHVMAEKIGEARRKCPPKRVHESLAHDGRQPSSVQPMMTYSCCERLCRGGAKASRLQKRFGEQLRGTSNQTATL